MKLSAVPPQILPVALGLATVGIGLLLATGRYPAALRLAAAAHATFCATAALPNHPFVGPLARRFHPAGREVWLTIDDGPHPDSTPGILALLRRHGAKATFFVIGQRAAQHPELLRAIVRDGHSLGNHTHRHPAATFWTAGPGRIAREIDRAAAAITAAGLPPPRFFRPPVGLANVFVAPALRRRGLLRVGWSARGFDTRPQAPARIVERIMSRCAPGTIILLHELGPSAGVRGLEPLLDRLAADGYHCVLPPEDAFRA